MLCHLRQTKYHHTVLQFSIDQDVNRKANKQFYGTVVGKTECLWPLLILMENDILCPLSRIKVD